MQIHHAPPHHRIARITGAGDQLLCLTLGPGPLTIGAQHLPGDSPSQRARNEAQAEAVKAAVLAGLAALATTTGRRFALAAIGYHQSNPDASPDIFEMMTIALLQDWLRQEAAPAEK